MKNNISFARQELLWRGLGICALLLLWEIAAHIFPPVIVPSVAQTTKKFVLLFQSGVFFSVTRLTFFRLVVGLMFGVSIGIILGGICGFFPAAEKGFAPFLVMVQAVPPVCWVTMALIWFGFNGKPAIFIVVLMSFPVIVINIISGIKNIDRGLLEMARVYEFSRIKKLRHVIIPAVFPHFYSALELVIAGGWKLIIMGEVLTTGTGIGGEVTLARLHIETDTLIAWAAVAVTLSFFSTLLLRRCVKNIYGGHRCCK